MSLYIRRATPCGRPSRDHHRRDVNGTRNADAHSEGARLAAEVAAEAAEFRERIQQERVQREERAALDDSITTPSRDLIRTRDDTSGSPVSQSPVFQRISGRLSMLSTEFLRRRAQLPRSFTLRRPRSFYPLEARSDVGELLFRTDSEESYIYNPETLPDRPLPGERYLADDEDMNAPPPSFPQLSNLETPLWNTRLMVRATPRRQTNPDDNATPLSSLYDYPSDTSRPPTPMEERPGYRPPTPPLRPTHCSDSQSSPADYEGCDEDCEGLDCERCGGRPMFASIINPNHLIQAAWSDDEEENYR